MKKPTEKEITKEFDKWVENYDPEFNDLQSIFEAGIEYMIEYQKKPKVLKQYNELGFPVDVKLILDIMTGVVEHKLYDELYNMDDIEITKVDTSRTKSNWSDTWIIIYFTAYWAKGKYENNSIKIDNRGRVFASVDEPWEGGGIKSEIEEIIMGLVTKAKYSFDD